MRGLIFCVRKIVPEIVGIRKILGLLQDLQAQHVAVTHALLYALVSAAERFCLLLPPEEGILVTDSSFEMGRQLVSFLMSGADSPLAFWGQRVGCRCVAKREMLDFFAKALWGSNFVVLADASLAIRLIETKQIRVVNVGIKSRDMKRDAVRYMLVVKARDESCPLLSKKVYR